jgi:hypothetical protein
MDSNDSNAFVELLVAYKYLWAEHATMKYLQENSQANAEEIKLAFIKRAEECLLPITEAVSSGTPLQKPLRDTLRNIPPM